MKVLVVGARGYISRKFAEYARERGEIDVTVVDSREEWKKTPFENFSSVIFTAGIAHRKQTKRNAHLYFDVNYSLAIDVAQKAKTAAVPHFIYLSSMAVFGKKQGEISAYTIPNPRHNDYYGSSKFLAENALINLQTADFSIAIVRPPMVYGSDCPGKFRQLARLAKFLPVCPCNKNKRSVIYIDKLSAFLFETAKNKNAGFFHPQDDKYASTSDLVKEIRRKDGKKTVILGMAWFLRVCMAVFPPMKTAFGSLYYEKDVGGVKLENSS